MSSAPAFIDISEQAQAEELLEYSASHGQKLAVSVEQHGMSGVVHALAENCGVCLKSSDEDATASMTSIFSLFHMVPPGELGIVVSNLCKAISSDVTEKNAKFRLSLLKMLFSILEEESPLHADVWLSMLQVAQIGKLLHQVETEPVKVQQLLKKWGCSSEKCQQVLRSLYDCLHETGQIRLATDVLVSLLSIYTNPSSSQAQEDAKKCIIESIKEPNTYLYDRLLQLPAVQVLKDEALLRLLNIFVSGNFSEYSSFYQSSPAVVTGAGLVHCECEHKMRILTFISLAAGASSGEVTFEDMKRELRLETDDDTEMLVIDAIRTTLVKAKIDQQRHLVTVSSCLQRTFGRAEWQMVRERFEKWRQNLGSIIESLNASKFQ